MADDELGGFAPPPFKADEALQQLRRSLRDLKLAERGNGFELRGKRVLELVAEDGAINARIARKLALTPEWDRQTLRSAPDQRKLVDEIKKRLARWEREE
ncbi:conserved hypothetical protein [Rubrivivax sp. A210]|uniref:hypothetical protein n=1 Tax=Rubrivivax sp. A210 TaxID=2772301 RepID=UPI001917C51B|nr:hypothetical protein [Rubrivivax sp. A210]CAD5374323.1 conserved hypothetical protein [Rubrivivax sp. A210]